MRLKQTDQGKKSVTLWFEQEKDQGYRLTTVDATNLLDAKEKQAVRKKSLLKKRKRYRIRPAYSATREILNAWSGGNARWRNGLSRDLPATRATRSGDGIQEKAKKLVLV